ncbi:MAG: DUF4114 domain-containing protein [Candidatus Eisenbacteria bacterium]
MKRSATPFLVALIATASLAAQAHAALRVPQVPVLGGTLQAYLNGIGESINVGTAQEATNLWTHTASTTTGYTIMIENSPSGGTNVVGMYNGSDASPVLRPVLLGVQGPEAFSLATFKPGGLLTVNRFDALGSFISATNYTGVDPTGFGFFISNPGGTFYTQDARNPGGKAQALAYKGTGGNAGMWWLCFEDVSVQGGSSDQDYDDCVIVMESVNTTPVSRTSWGQLKTRMR